MSLTSKLRKYALLWAVCAATLSACSQSEASLKPSIVIANDAAPQYISTPTPILTTVSPTTVAEPEGCKTIRTITICVQDIKHTDADTQVTLKIFVESNMVSGFGNSFIFPDDERGLYPALLDEQGRSYSLDDGADNYWAVFDDVQGVYFQTLYFQPVPADVKKLTVSLPVVAVDSPSKAQEGFQLDLGSNPQPGQTNALDITTIIDGQKFHFVKAEFGGDGVSSLPVTLYTDPLNLPNDIFSITPLFADGEKMIFFGAKQGMDGLPLRIFADLVIPPGKSSRLTNNTYITGILNLKVDRIIYWFRGPFEIQVKLP